MKTLEKIVKKIYSEMINADKEAWNIMGEAIFGDNKDIELKFDRLSTKAVTLENLLLNFVDQDKTKELLNKANDSKEINNYYDCFMICKNADVDEKGNKFKGWNLSLHLYTKSHEMTADEFWNIYKNYL